MIPPAGGDATEVSEGAAAASAVRVLLVVPTLGRRLQTLERTLASVTSQAGVAVDVRLVCPAPSPEVQALAARFGAGMIAEAGHISAAVNRGWADAGRAHRYVAWLGDDDVLRDGALSRSVQALEAQPRAVVAFGHCDYIDEDAALLFTRRPPAGASWLLQFVPGLIKQETCLFRRDAVVRVGGLDEQLRYAMDLDLLLRLRRLGPFARVDTSQAGFCWHADSITIANREASLDEAQGIQQRLARGLSAIGFRLVRPVFRWLILLASSRINKTTHGARA